MRILAHLSMWWVAPSNGEKVKKPKSYNLGMAYAEFYPPVGTNVSFDDII